jgi:septal ring-binding cell division protein DamX
MPARRWTIRLEIANLPATLKNAVVAFPGRKPDLFIAPIKLRGGKTAYQLFLGDYATKAEAEQAARSVPAVFLEGGSRPKPFLIGEIPSQVGR